MSAATCSEEIRGAVRIGSSGTKWHPAVKLADGRVVLRCRCAYRKGTAPRGFKAEQVGTCQS